MNIKSLLAATVASVGIYFILTALSIGLTKDYLSASMIASDFDAASIALNFLKLNKYIAILLACYFTIGFANRLSLQKWQYTIYAAFVSIPIIFLATFPDLALGILPDLKNIINNIHRLLYYALAALVGLFFGLRFNKLKGI